MCLPQLKTGVYSGSGEDKIGVVVMKMRFLRFPHYPLSKIVLLKSGVFLLFFFFFYLSVF